MKYLKKIINFIWAHKWASLAGLIIIVLVVFFGFKGNTPTATTTTVERGTVLSEVSVTGTVKPAQSVEMAFETSGRFTDIQASVGEHITRGQILANLDGQQESAQIMQAKASLASEKATLTQLEQGARPQEIQAKELALSSAKEVLSGYYTDAVTVSDDAYAKSSDAVRNKIDAMFDNDESDSPSLTFSSGDSQAEVNAEFDRLRATNALDAWDVERTAVKTSFSDDGALQLLKNAVDHMEVVLTLLSDLQNTLASASGISQTTIDTYKTNINTARVNVVGSLSSTQAQIQAINKQVITVKTAQNDLDLTREGTRQETIDAQKAKVAYAQSQVAYAQSQWEKTVIRAPFNGIVTKIDIDQGQIVTANTPAIAVIGEGKYEIEANVAESDISKVSVNKTATVTLDAYGSGVVFDAIVEKVDIGATMIEGVATYKTTLLFTDQDSRILPGLTANIDILNDKKDNVLYVPTRNIFRKDGKIYVTVQKDDKTTVDKEITTGLRGSDGRTEVLSGVSEGEVLVMR